MHVMLIAIALAQAAAPPWRTDAEAARADALRERRPLILILHVDAAAL